MESGASCPDVVFRSPAALEFGVADGPARLPDRSGEVAAGRRITGKDADDPRVASGELRREIDEILDPFSRPQGGGLADDHLVGPDPLLASCRLPLLDPPAEHRRIDAQRNQMLPAFRHDASNGLLAIHPQLIRRPEQSVMLASGAEGQRQ